MDVSDASSWFLIPFQILIVDLLLGADNALVIGLACRNLPPRQMRQAALIGVSGAVIIRTLLAVVATALLAIPLVKIAGALILLVIALNLVAGEQFGEAEHTAAGGRGLWSAAAIILVADTAMSLDNVVALAAIARGNYLWLAAGVGLSLPIIAFGGVMISALLSRAPWLVEIGAALLGWIALGMAISDPVFHGWVEAQAPALAVLAPPLGAAFVWLYGRLIAKAPRPIRRPEPKIARPPPPDPAPPPLLAPEPANLAPDPEAPAVAPPAETRDDRLAIMGVLLLALVAGGILMVVSYLDSVN